jgi:hypothetical protein
VANPLRADTPLPGVKLTAIYWRREPGFSMSAIARFRSSLNFVYDSIAMTTSSSTTHAVASVSLIARNLTLETLATMKIHACQAGDYTHVELQVRVWSCV